MSNKRTCAIPGCRGITLAIEADGQVRCLSHATDPDRIRRREERNRAGGLNRLRTLPESTPVPKFTTATDVRKFAERTAHQVLTGQLERQVAETGLKAAGLALQVRQVENQERLTNALLAMEHGQAAVALMAQLQQHNITPGPRRPLPGVTAKALPAADQERS